MARGCEKADHVIKIVNFEVRHFSLTFTEGRILQSASTVKRQFYKVPLSFYGSLVIALSPVPLALPKFEAACRADETIATHYHLQDTVNF